MLRSVEIFKQSGIVEFDIGLRADCFGFTRFLFNQVQDSKILLVTDWEKTIYFLMIIHPLTQSWPDVWHSTFMNRKCDAAHNKYGTVSLLALS